MTDDELQESFAWHAEEHIPFDISDVNLDYHVTGTSADAIHVLMAACKRDKIANVKQAIQLAGKQPAIIDVDAFALQNCYELNYDPQPVQVVALLHIGASTTNINILNGSRSVFTRDASFGCNQYTSLLQKELGLTFDQAEQVKRGMPLPEGVEQREIEPILDTVSDILALEIQKTMDFYRATVEDSESAVERILVSGGGSKLSGLADFLEKQRRINEQMMAVKREQADLEKKIADINFRIDAIQKLRGAQQGPSEVLAEIKARFDGVPGLYLRSVEQKDAELLIKGESPNE